MKLRTLIVLVIGLALGYKLAKRTTQDDPAIVKGPRDERPAANPAMRMISGQAQRLADQATVKSLDVIRGARRAIRSRLTDDDPAWN